MKKDKGWEITLKFLSLILLGYHLIHLFLLWTDVPGNIVIHFENGEPDNWGSRYFLLIMPVIGLLIWWLLGKLTKYPEKLNYINLTDENREIQYKMSCRVLWIIQNLSFITFILGNEAFLRYATGDNDNTFFFLSIFSLVFVLLATFYNLIWAARLKV